MRRVFQLKSWDLILQIINDVPIPFKFNNFALTDRILFWCEFHWSRLLFGIRDVFRKKKMEVHLQTLINCLSVRNIRESSRNQAIFVFCKRWTNLLFISIVFLEDNGRFVYLFIGYFCILNEFQLEIYNFVNNALELTGLHRFFIIEDHNVESIFVKYMIDSDTLGWVFDAFGCVIFEPNIISVNLIEI